MVTKRDQLAAEYPHDRVDPWLRRNGLDPSQHVVAAEITRAFGRYARHSPGAGWTTWTNGFGWEPNSGSAVLDLIRRVAAHLTDHDDYTAAVRRSVQSSSFVAGVEKMMRADRAHHTPIGEWDHSPDVVGLPAGLVADLRTGDIRPARLGDYITRRLDCVPEWPADCPRWLRFLNEATGFDAELVGLIQRWAGYCLTGRTREHTLMFVHGDGGTGKTTLVNVLRQLLGGYAVHASMDTFLSARGERHPTDLAMLHRARLVTAVETDERRPWDEARLKALTGDDPITARFIRRDFFTYTPRFKLTIVGNHLPTLRSPDEAMRRRFRVIPFNQPPARPDPKLADKLRAELPGILAWAIDGARHWYQDGLGDAAIVQEATSEYFTEADLIGQWLDETCDLIPGSHHSETAAALWACWKAWARDRRADIGTQTRLGRELGRRGPVKHRTRAGIRWHGIQLHQGHQPSLNQGP